MAIQFTFVKLFQSTLPRGERQHLLSVTKLIIYFNPRSHEGSDLHPTKNSGAGWIISIHAPTRGATVKNRFGLTDGKFQSTLPRGERRRKWKVFLVCIYFNPRSHEGSDSGTECISNAFRNFNPRSHEGSDTLITGTAMPSIIFQSTLPRGERHLDISLHLNSGHFNPRSHEGSDANGIDPGDIEFVISIHAPTRGATATLTNFFFYNQSIFC